MANEVVTFTGKNEIAIHAVPRPVAGPREVVIETSCTLISAGTECICLQRNFEARTHWDGWVQYPFYPGYCGVGRIAEVGDAVEGWAVGTRVAGWTAHQRFVATGTAKLVRVPDGLPDEEAAWMPMGVIAGYGFRKGAVQPGETVVVIGLGMLGQLVVQYAALAGAGRIIAVDPAAPRLTFATAQGATHALAAGAQEAEAAIREITGGAMANVVYEMTGHAPVFAAAQTLLADFGRMVLVGDTGYPERQHLTPHFIRNNLTIIGAHQRLAAQDPVWHHARLGTDFLEGVAAGRFRVKGLITHRFGLNDAAEAYRLLTTRRDAAMGVVLDFGGAEDISAQASNQSISGLVETK